MAERGGGKATRRRRTLDLTRLTGLRLGPLANSVRRWAVMFPRLERFYREFGHSRVSEGWADDPQLGSWVQSTRQRWKAGGLRPEQRRDLERVGFEPSPRAAEWARSLDHLRRYQERHGHTSVPRWSKEFPLLGVFVTNLRVRIKPRAPKRLSQAQRDELDRLGFDWKPLPRTERKVVELEHLVRTGRAVPRSGELGAWVQTALRGKAPLDAAQVRRLEALGLDIPTKEKRTRARTEAVQQKKRARIARGKRWPPPPPRPRTAVFDEKLEALRAFAREFGHTRIPGDDPLHTWVNRLRSRKRAGELAPAQVAALEAVGFEFEPFEATWKENFALLGAYHRRFGHCDVPRFWKEDPWLGPWVTSLRQQRKAGKLPPRKVRALDALGFTWDVPQARWTRAMRELDAFIAKHGHARVPSGAGRLGTYLVEVRRAGRRGKLTPAQLQDLKARSVELEPRLGPKTRNRQWAERFARLEAFHARFGHCDVPRTFADAEGVKLGFWASKQREANANGELAPERKQRLDGLGFRWSGYPVTPHAPELDEAVEFHRAHGHWMAGGSREAWLRGLGPRSDPRVLARLSALGAPSTGEDWAWERMYALARGRWARTRRVDAPPSTALGAWLARQRALALTGDLDPNREARLAEVRALNQGE